MQRSLDQFADDWLAMREPIDGIARASELTALLNAQPAALASSTGHGVLRVLDLGCGTGSNLRYLAPRLGGTQHWRCLDHDPAHLARLDVLTKTWAAGQGYGWNPEWPSFHCARTSLHCHLQVACQDLARSLGSLSIADANLVTASALLDLVSETWLQELVGRCAAGGLMMLMALSIDGRVELAPALDADDWIMQAVTAHQRRDKGFGPALGAHAVGCLRELAMRNGYAIVTCPSDWILGPEQRAMQRHVIEGWSQAALEQIPDSRAAILRWRHDRLGALMEGKSLIRIGHQDLFAWMA